MKIEYFSLINTPAESIKERTSWILRINHAVKLKTEAIASRVDIISIFRRGHLPLWSLVFQSYYQLKKYLLAFRHCYVTMSIQRPITKKSYVTCKKPLNEDFVKRDCSL